MLTLELGKKAGYNSVMNIPQEEDIKLVEGLKSGNEQAFRELVEKYQDRAFSVAFGLMHDTEEAKDAVQESFIRVFKKVRSFKGDSRFYTWYYRLLVNICLDAKRKRKLVSALSIFKPGYGSKEMEANMKVDSKEEPEEKLAVKETENKVWQSLELLSARERQVFELRHYQGFKLQEVADIMEIKLGTVKALLFHGVQKLKNNLKEGEL